jgi:hypothetical protein
MARYIIVGDIHGCLAEFNALLDACGVAYDDKIVSVEDLVAKGTLQRLMRMGRRCSGGFLHVQDRIPPVSFNFVLNVVWYL